MPNALEQRLVDRVIATAKKAGVEVPADVLSIAARLEHGTAATMWEQWQKRNPDRDPASVDIGCCMGSAIYGMERCTCWEPVYTDDQADPVLPVPDGSIQIRHARCGDCAFKRGSVERADPLMEEELVGLAVAGTPFWCHDGMIRPKFYRHPTLGDVPASGDDWRPPQVAGVPFRRDGSPGLLCAGWAGEVKRQDRITKETDCG